MSVIPLYDNTVGFQQVVDFFKASIGEWMSERVYIYPTKDNKTIRMTLQFEVVQTDDNDFTVMTKKNGEIKTRHGFLIMGDSMGVRIKRRNSVSGIDDEYTSANCPTESELRLYTTKLGGKGIDRLNKDYDGIHFDTSRPETGLTTFKEIIRFPYDSVYRTRLSTIIQGGNVIMIGNYLERRIA